MFKVFHILALLKARAEEKKARHRLDMCRSLVTCVSEVKQASYTDENVVGTAKLLSDKGFEVTIILRSESPTGSVTIEWNANRAGGK